MNLKEMSVKDVFCRSVKKIIIESVSVKFWAAIFLACMNAHIIFADHKFDLFGMSAFLLCLGIREAADYLQQIKKGETK